MLHRSLRVRADSRPWIIALFVLGTVLGNPGQAQIYPFPQTLYGFAPDGRFGAALAVGGSSAYCSLASLAVWVPGDDGNDGAVPGYCADADAISYAFWLGPGLKDDDYGYALAWGDFDGDGCQDLAVGVPLANVPTPNGDSIARGTVDIYYCGETGPERQRLFGGDEALGRFGTALAAGDINGDGRDDLAVSTPFHNSMIDHVGRVQVFPGAAGGIIANASQVSFEPGEGPIMDGSIEQFFGTSLAIADLVPGGDLELVVGAPAATVDGGSDAGKIYMIEDVFGANPTATDLSQASAGVPGAAEAQDRFGETLTTGDFDCDGQPELAVGAPDEDYGTSSSGVAFLIDFQPFVATLVTEESLRPGGSAHLLDHFAAALAAGDLDADGCDDLAIGVPGESVGTNGNAGLVLVRFGTAGPARATQAVFDQDLATADHFGSALAIGQLDRSGGEDLVVGSPDFDLGSSLHSVGKVDVFPSDALFRNGFD